MEVPAAYVKDQCWEVKRNLEVQQSVLIGNAFQNLNAKEKGLLLAGIQKTARWHLEENVLTAGRGQIKKERLLVKDLVLLKKRLKK